MGGLLGLYFFGAKGVVGSVFGWCGLGLGYIPAMQVENWMREKITVGAVMVMTSSSIPGSPVSSAYLITC